LYDKELHELPRQTVMPAKSRCTGTQEISMKGNLIPSRESVSHNRNMRLQFDMLESSYHRLTQVMDATGMATKKELFENALTLLEWAIEETAEGNVVGVLDTRTNHFQKLRFAPLAILYAKTQKKHVVPFRKDDHQNTTTSTGEGLSEENGGTAPTSECGNHDHSNHWSGKRTTRT